MITESIYGSSLSNTTAVGADSSTSVESTDAMGKDEFLTLLVAQLQNQDPLNPMESQEFSAQLAQFSSLEQLFNVNDNLGNIQTMLSAQENDNSLDYVGKTIKSYSNTIFKNDGTVDECSYYLDQDANVTVSIYDESGAEVFSVQDGWKTAGQYSFSWDGVTDNNGLAPDGTYTYAVTAADEGGFEVSTNTYITGEVTGVNYSTGTPYLVIGERMINPANIIEVTKTSD